MLFGSVILYQLLNTSRFLVPHIICTKFLRCSIYFCIRRIFRNYANGLPMKTTLLQLLKEWRWFFYNLINLKCKLFHINPIKSSKFLKWYTEILNLDLDGSPLTTCPWWRRHKKRLDRHSKSYCWLQRRSVSKNVIILINVKRLIKTKIFIFPL